MAKAAPLSFNLCTDAAQWQAALCAMDYTALQQDWGYGEFMEQIGRRTVRLIWQNDHKILAAAQIITRRIGPIELVFALRSPVFVPDISDADKIKILSDISCRYPRRKLKFLILMPELGPNKIIHRALNKIFRQRIMTGNLNAVINLKHGVENLRAAQSAAWRNRLVKAEQSKLTVKIVRQGPLMEWLLQQETAQEELRGYQALPPALVREMIRLHWHPQDVWVAVAMLGKDPVAGQLWLRHGNSATYMYGVNTPAGRQENAHNLLIWKMIENLSAAGLYYADMGPIDAETNAGLTRFKLESGADPCELLGSYH
ncbi:MAG TPA: GNAT family N-acetyltransferase [Alphaproteobacteria bacterium]|nr:hypothetical protein [Rhodospirillaceae bacterium]HRJ12379.1 GNAT family N-acetyltransferase [Alphaproteobacteria bacterium]